MYLKLNPSIRNWVFFPITALTITINLLMKYLNFILNQNKDKQSTSSSSQKNREGGEFSIQNELSKCDIEVSIKSAMSRANRLKTNFMHISERGFKSRKSFFCKEGDGFFTKNYPSKSADMMNPNMMGDMLKKNVVNGLYYAILFVGVGFLFSGFILLKLPFGLTQKFRGMMQQGLNLPDLDVSYVSAISWCAILVFGLEPILQHFDGSDNFSMMKEQEQMMKAPLQMGFGPEAKDFKKICTSEKENLEIIHSFSLLDDATDNFIEKYKGLL